MEKVFFVRNGDLDEVNRCLQEGGRVKMIQVVSNAVSCGGEGFDQAGDVFAYIVVSFE